MSIKQALRSLLFTGAVGVGLALGAPLNPNQIEELLHQLNQPKVAHVIRQQNEDDDD